MVQQFGASVCYERMIRKIGIRCDVRADADNPSDVFEAADSLFQDGQRVQRRNPRRCAGLLLWHAPGDHWLPIDEWKHPTEKHEWSCLFAGHILAQGRRGRRQFESQLLQPLFGAHDQWLRSLMIAANWSACPEVHELPSSL